LAINCEIKAHDLGFSFDLRFYLAHILCDSRCASGINPFPEKSLKICENLRKNRYSTWHSLPTSFFAEQFHIFVGDLSSEIETQQLREAFTPFGEIS